MRADVPYFDAHCDTISVLFDQGGSLRENQFHLDLARMSAYGPAAQFFAVWGGHYREKAALLKAELSKNADLAMFCKTPDCAGLAARQAKLAAFLSVEGAEQLDCSVPKLRAAHDEDGVIMINLCWNHDNILCGSAMDGGGGLTEEGRGFVRAAQEIGVVIDLSHASEKTFWDVIGMTSRPVVASQSNAAALFSVSPRNLTDAQFVALVKCGGGAGLNLCPGFLGENPGIEACVAHIEHFLALGGEKSIFIGADLDGIDQTPRGVSGVQDMYKLFDALLRRNHSEGLIRDIFYYNLLGILERAV